MWPQAHLPRRYPQGHWSEPWQALHRTDCFRRRPFQSGKALSGGTSASGHYNHSSGSFPRAQVLPTIAGETGGSGFLLDAMPEKRASDPIESHLSMEIILGLMTAAGPLHQKARRKFSRQKGTHMKRLEGKIAVVTGGNSGIGLATAKRLQEEGARVAISGRSQKTLAEAVKTIGNGVLAVQSDVAKLADIDKLFAEVSQKLGKIDVLFVNAGVAKFAPLADTPESLFDEQFDINIKGAYFTIQKALPFLNDGASIILNTSVASIKGTIGGSVYSATKAALRSLARTAAAELVTRGIRVNAVAPGPIETPIFGRTGLPQEVVDQVAQGFVSKNPMLRFGQPSEVAAAVAFLASQDASYITGVELNVDGGTGQI